MSAHEEFAAALAAPTFACPPGLKTWNGSDPARRFGIYRNNVAASLTDAMADSYPVVQQLVGDAFFRAMAGEFVGAFPPRSPVLAWYGASFPDFIAAFPPVAELPYLADVARLEWRRVESWHSADAVPVTECDLTNLLADEAKLARSRFVLHPAARLLTSRYPVASLWAAHQSDTAEVALGQIDMSTPETALLVRPDLDVEIFRIESAAGKFIERLNAGVTFGDAAAIEQFDLVATLTLLLQTRSIVGFSTTEETQ